MPFNSLGFEIPKIDKDGIKKQTEEVEIW